MRKYPNLSKRRTHREAISECEQIAIDRTAILRTIARIPPLKVTLALEPFERISIANATMKDVAKKLVKMRIRLGIEVKRGEQGTFYLSMFHL